MKRMKAHLIGIDQGSVILFSDFEDAGPMWVGSGPRQSRRWVDFSSTFAAVPVVQVGLSMWDTSSGMNQRMDLRAENIEPFGFDLVFRTWADSQVARVRANWTAIGEMVHDEGWELY